MIPYLQINRPMRVTTPLGPDVLLLVGLKGIEGLSQLYSFQLDLLAPVVDAVDFHKLLGQPIGMQIEPATLSPRWFHGVARSVTQSGQDEEFVHFEMEVVPKFWLWTQRHRSRIFQQLNVPDILNQVLDGLDFELKLTGQYLPRNYCVQYRETDFAFASRLMEEEGIFYYFEHSADGCKLILADAVSSLTDYAAPNVVTYETLQGGLRSDERVSAWRKTQQVRPTNFTLWDHCFQLPGQNLSAEAALPVSSTAGTVQHTLAPKDNELEIYDYPGEYAKRFDGVAPGGGDSADGPSKIFQENQRTVRLRSEEQAAQTIDIAGQSNCALFSPGFKFVLADHFNADGAYVLKRVEHAARLNVGYRSNEEGEVLLYENKFRCAPIDLPLRPPRVTPRPTIASVQTATVVGPSGSEIFIDKYGRVKVQFHWDRLGKNNADSSCWLRVGQVWAGNRWGGFFWPRVGHEVVVVFVEGDPDRPLIVGSVYNAANMPPTDLPEQAKVGGVKSCIFSGNPLINFNALYFHDTPGTEYIQLHSEKDEVVHAETNKLHYVPVGEFSFRGNIL
ncbi:MAG: type VI secretion system tip protein TssI/VgrG [Pirellulaceae bacterium]